MIKAKNKSQTKLKHFSFNLRVSFYYDHKLLQMFISMEPSAIENNMEP